MYSPQLATFTREHDDQPVDLGVQKNPAVKQTQTQLIQLMWCSILERKWGRTWCITCWWYDYVDDFVGLLCSPVWYIGRISRPRYVAETVWLRYNAQQTAGNCRKRPENAKRRPKRNASGKERLHSKNWREHWWERTNWIGTGFRGNIWPRNMWRFPKIGVPPNHPFIDGFSLIGHPLLGVPPFWETPM